MVSYLGYFEPDGVRGGILRSPGEGGANGFPAPVIPASLVDELKLNGFFSALDSIPEPAEMERTFGKGKSHDSEDAPVEGEQEVERLFAMKDGKIVLNKEALKGN